MFTFRQDGEAALGDLKKSICILCILGDVHTRETPSEEGVSTHPIKQLCREVSLNTASLREAGDSLQEEPANTRFPSLPPPSCGLGEGGTHGEPTGVGGTLLGREGEDHPIPASPALCCTEDQGAPGHVVT